MYSGKELGDAIRSALKLKGARQAEMARFFGIKQQSVSGWLKHGRVAKEHIDKLVTYFSDVVPPSHFGIQSLTLTQTDHSTQNVNASNVGVQIGRDNYGDVSNIKMCETAQPCEDGQNLKTTKPLPLLDIDDAVEYLLNPHIKADKIKDANEHIATYIDHSDRTVGVKIHDNGLAGIFGIIKDDSLIIEPEIPPRDNDLVLVCLNCKTSPRGIVARLELGLDNEYRLIYGKSATEASPMPVNSVICGVVVAVKRRLVNSEIVKSRRNRQWDIWKTAVSG